MMGRFTELLRRTNEKLDLPQPEKSRILLEIASDLEDTYEFYRGRGLSEEEAAEKTREKFEISAEALAELAVIHESTFRKLLNRLSLETLSRWERALLAAIVVFIAAFAGREILSTGFFRQAGPFVWPVIGVALVMLAAAIFQAYKLCIKKDHRARGLRVGVHRLLAFGGLSLLTGFCAFCIDLYQSVQMGVAGTEKILAYLVDCAIRCSAMLLVSLLVTIAAGLIWFVLMDRVRRIEVAEAAWLLE
jgi:hypothetical protein